MKVDTVSAQAKAQLPILTELELPTLKHATFVDTLLELPTLKHDTFVAALPCFSLGAEPEIAAVSVGSTSVATRNSGLDFKSVWIISTNERTSNFLQLKLLELGIKCTAAFVAHDLDQNMPSLVTKLRNEKPELVWISI